MKRLVKSISGGQGGFTLIELLVVIAILGVIAAVVALNVAGFFGRGTLQAAKTEAHQAQTAIIAAMADAGSNVVLWDPDNPATAWPEDETLAWAGEPDIIVVRGPQGDKDAASYLYGPFRAVYEVDDNGAIVAGDPDPAGINGWGTSIDWCDAFSGWVKEGDCPDNG